MDERYQVETGLHRGVAWLVGFVGVGVEGVAIYGGGLELLSVA